MDTLQIKTTISTVIVTENTITKSDNCVIQALVELQNPADPESCIINLCGYDFLPEELERLILLSKKLKNSSTMFK